MKNRKFAELFKAILLLIVVGMVSVSGCSYGFQSSDDSVTIEAENNVIDLRVEKYTDPGNSTCAFKIKREDYQLIVTDTWTLIEYDDIEFDYCEGWSNETYRYSIQEQGYYFFRGFIQWQNLGEVNTLCRLRVVVDGENVVNTMLWLDGGTWRVFDSGGIAWCEVDDEVYMQVMQDSGLNRNITQNGFLEVIPLF